MFLSGAVHEETRKVSFCSCLFLSFSIVFFQYDSTLLHEAVTIGNPEIVAILLQYKAKVNATNKVSGVPLELV